MFKERLNEHQVDYIKEAWKNYSIAELGYWIHLLSKRATHRNKTEKTKKDLHDAKNYLLMLEENLKQKAIELNIDWNEI